METRKQQLLRRHRRSKRIFMVVALLVLAALDWFGNWNSLPVLLVLAWIAHEAWFADHRLGIQVGFLALLVIAGFAAVSNGIIGYFMQRMSGGRALSYAFIAAMGVGAVPGFQLLLVSWLAGLLHLDRVHPLIIVGMGNVGIALARFPPFNSGPFRVVAGFDSDPQKVGRKVGSVTIHDLSDLPGVIAGTGASMAILAVPAVAAPLAHRSLVECGIRSILNFAPVTLSPLPDCRVKNVDLRIHLEELAFFLASGRMLEAGV